MIKTDGIVYIFRDNHFLECTIIDIIDDGFISENNPFNKFKLNVLNHRNVFGMQKDREIIAYRYEILHDNDIEQFLQLRIKEIKKKLVSEG